MVELLPILEVVVLMLGVLGLVAWFHRGGKCDDE
jgi:hypothetical protein